MRTRVLCAGLLISLGVVLAACGGTPTPPTFHPTFKGTPCPEDVTSVVLTPVTCGFLTVLEDRSRPDGRTIKLFVVRVEPAGGHPAPDPVFVAGDLGEAPGWADNAGLAQRVNREVILLDERGTGHSEPNLECPEVSSLGEALAGSRLSDPEARQDLREAVGACRARLVGSGVDLSQYDLEENASDVEDLRQALGIARWNLTSHGTTSRILLEVVRRFPQRIRSVVLDTPSFPQASDPIEAIQATKAALGQLFADCAAQPACDRRFPDRPRAMREAVTQLDRTPIEVKVSDSRAASRAGHAIGVTVDGGAFLRVIRAMASDIDLGMASKVPATIDAAIKGDVGTVARLLSDDSGLCVGYEPKCGVEHPFVEGAYYSLLCHDGAPFADPSQLVSLAEGDAGYLEAYANGPYLSDICKVWKAGRAGADVAAPVTSSIPMLIYVGAYDSYGSSRVTDEAASTLSRAFIVSVPFVGHNAMATSECYITIRNAWMETPTSAPDISCTAKVPGPTFEVG
jgi:pimeloyl-ACP methyl ester carboxylesterase